MLYFKQLVLALIFATTVGPAANAGVLLIDPGTDDRIASISEVEIAGEKFDVTFHHGIAFNDLGPGAITFNTLESAIVASAAIDSVLSESGVSISDAAADNALFTNRFLVSYNTPNAEIVESINRNIFSFPFYDFEDTPFYFPEARNAQVDQTLAYTTFTPSSAATVPEPSTMTSFAVFALGATAFQRRRKRN